MTKQNDRMTEVEPLNLNRETVQDLAEAQAEQVMGGGSRTCEEIPTRQRHGGSPSGVISD